MENLSLYDCIQKLKQGKEDVTTFGKYLRYKGFSREIANKQADVIFNQIENRLEEIDNQYALDYKDLTSLISKHYNKKFNLKCFREVETVWEVENGTMRPKNNTTGRWLMCFVAENNKFFNAKQNNLGYSYLNETDYEELLQIVNEDDFIVLADEELGHGMFALESFKRNNYIQMVTQNHWYNGSYFYETTRKILGVIKNYLKTAEYTSEDTMFNNLDKFNNYLNVLKREHQRKKSNDLGV